MKIKKKLRDRSDRSNAAPAKSLFVELNGQLQSYLNALKTSAPEQRSN